MTLIVGDENFASARRAAAEAAAQQVRDLRDAALTDLIETRAAFADQAEQRYASGARLAGRDCDRLEALATRLVGFVDNLEPEFERLDVARDVTSHIGLSGRRFTRSSWDRAALVLALGEALHDLLDPAAAAVLTAAVRLEARA